MQKHKKPENQKTILGRDQVYLITTVLILGFKNLYLIRYLSIVSILDGCSSVTISTYPNLSIQSQLKRLV